jgi:hypothetical protein
LHGNLEVTKEGQSNTHRARSSQSKDDFDEELLTGGLMECVGSRDEIACLRILALFFNFFFMYNDSPTTVMLMGSCSQCVEYYEGHHSAHALLILIKVFLTIAGFTLIR